MRKSKWILAIICVVMILGAFFYAKATYLFMPYEYKKSEIVSLDWREFQNPIILEICYHGWESECLYSTDKNDIRYVIESLQGLHYATRSRGEFRELDYSDVDLTEMGIGFYYDHQYKVIIRNYEEISEGYDLGNWIYAFDVYTFTDYVNGPHGTYYYYEIPSDLRDFIYSAEDSFVLLE